MYCSKLISGVCRRHLSTIACSVASACESGLHLWLCCDGIPCLLVNIVRTGHEQRPTALHRTQALKVRLPTIFWLSCCSAASSTLRWAVSRSAVPGVVAKTHRNGETKNKERSIDIKKILKVETGTGQFPGSNGTKGQLSSLSAKINLLVDAAHVLEDNCTHGKRCHICAGSMPSSASACSTVACT
jgi:acetyltransferase-like isoleucine patch superfamily enzyme